MAVICKKCGGPHPVWDCKASTAQIAAFNKSTAAPVSEPRKGQPKPGKGASRTVPQASHADTRVEVASGGSDPSRTTGGRHQQPALRTGVASGAVDTPIIEGATFVAEVPAGTRLLTYGNRVLAAGPDLTPSIVTSKGLVPITAPLSELKKGGRPRKVEDRAAYKAEKAKAYRAKAQQK